jgi:hypothetical protein
MDLPIVAYGQAVICSVNLIIVEPPPFPGASRKEFLASSHHDCPEPLNAPGRIRRGRQMPRKA